jgi:hypothetical protein
MHQNCSLESHRRYSFPKNADEPAQIILITGQRANTACIGQVGVLPPFSSIFLASSFLCSQADSTPAHTQVPITALVKSLKTNGFYVCQVESIRAVEEKNSHGSFWGHNLFLNQQRCATLVSAGEFMMRCDLLDVCLSLDLPFPAQPYFITIA